MLTIPPTPAQKAYKRVLRISRLNGWSVAIFGGLSMLVALLFGDLVGAFIGLCVTLAGWMEIRGGRQLRRRDVDGMKLLVRSQLFLLAVILSYCASRLGSFDSETVLANLTPDMEAVLTQAGLEKADVVVLVHTVFLALYITVAVVCLIYQGGLALYYRGKTKLVAEAITAPIAIPAQDLLPS